MLSIIFPQRDEQTVGSGPVGHVYPDAGPRHPVAQPTLSFEPSSQTSFEAINESPHVDVQI